MMTFQISRRLSFACNRGQICRSLQPFDVWKWAGAVLFLCSTTVSLGQSFAALVNLTGPNGNDPWSLVQGTDGNLYGTTDVGGANQASECGSEGCGIVFKISPAGMMTTVYNFCAQSGCPDGSYPRSGLVLGSDGNFYGTTAGGGVGQDSHCLAYGNTGCGTVFRVTPEGVLTTLYSFCQRALCADGVFPNGSLVQASDGNFYGTTWGARYGGTGTFFRITPTGGVLTTLYTFCAQAHCLDGGGPSGVIQAWDGNFYGTTTAGGTSIGGTIFEITPLGRLTTLYNFVCITNITDCPAGSYPSGLVQGMDGNFYGTTEMAGSAYSGTVFKVTSRGGLTTLYNFCTQSNYSDGNDPRYLIRGLNGTFYGTTNAGGTATCLPPIGCGTVFRLTADGKLTTLHRFCVQPENCDEGTMPAGLVLATDGNFYGAAAEGGIANRGTIFRISTGLSPFVRFVRDSGKVGATAQILGQGFTGTTHASFNGTAAAFAVHSDTYLTATVPAGAEWGFVTVTTPNGIRKSDEAFRVTPQIFNLSTSSGSVGSTVVITGITLARTYAITFGNVKATNYTVDSDTQVTVTVPSGAQNGKIAVLTPGGTAYSPDCFDVTH